MFGFLQNPHAFAATFALVTALLAYLYARTIETDKKAQTKVFWKTLIAGGIAGLLLTWLAHGRSEPVATEPFNSEI
jgi:hypothetical protein